MQLLVSRPWQPLKLGFDASSIVCINLPRSPTNVLFCIVSCGPGQSPKVPYYFLYARLPMVLAIESWRQLCPDHRVDVSCKRPLAQPSDRVGRRSRPRPIADVFRNLCPFPPLQLFSRLFETIAVDEGHSDRTGRAPGAITNVIRSSMDCRANSSGISGPSSNQYRRIGKFRGSQIREPQPRHAILVILSRRVECSENTPCFQ